jgi:hypothetical protein
LSQSRLCPDKAHLEAGMIGRSRRDNGTRRFRLHLRKVDDPFARRLGLSGEQSGLGRFDDLYGPDQGIRSGFRDLHSPLDDVAPGLADPKLMGRPTGLASGKAAPTLQGGLMTL